MLLDHNTPADVPIQEFPTGGLFNNTPVNSNPYAQDMFVPFSAVAAGLAISPDGSTLYVANYQNDSLSIMDTSTRTVTKEVVFFAPAKRRQSEKCLTGRWSYRIPRARRLRRM